MKAQSRITSTITKNRGKQPADFTLDGKTLFGLLTLIIEIQHKHQETMSFDNNTNSEYIDDMNIKHVLADKTPLVDNGLLGH